MSTPIALVALLAELITGYPEMLSKRVGHPVTWMGRLISYFDARLNRESAAPETRRRAGAIALFLLLAVVGAIAFALETALLLIPFGVIAVGILCSTFIAQRSLYLHVANVADALDSGNLAKARREVAHIVGRDTDELDEAGVARAAIESLAENFSDGVVSPVFWISLAGMTGGALYKAINTADSMIGHLTERHAAFGAAAAKLDDLFNLPASRLAALWLVLAAGVHREGSVKAAFAVMRRDGTKHRSPNAGWPEAAMAGALGLKLGGPRDYHGATADEPWIGDGSGEVTAADIRRALKLYIIAWIIQILVLVLLLLVIARL